MNKRIDVALILWNRDVIELVSLVLLSRNLISSGCEPCAGQDTIENLIVSSRPSVVVFDLDPPYERSSEVARRLIDRFPDRSFVMTCADTVLALKKAPWLSAHPLFQKPYDMAEIANTVGSMRHRSVRFAELSIASS